MTIRPLCTKKENSVQCSLTKLPLLSTFPVWHHTGMGFYSLPSIWAVCLLLSFFMKSFPLVLPFYTDAFCLRWPNLFYSTRINLYYSFGFTDEILPSLLSFCGVPSQTATVPLFHTWVFLSFSLYARSTERFLLWGCAVLPLFPLHTPMTLEFQPTFQDFAYFHLCGGGNNITIVFVSPLGWLGRGFDLSISCHLILFRQLSFRTIQFSTSHEMLLHFIVTLMELGSEQTLTESVRTYIVSVAYDCGVPRYESAFLTSFPPVLESSRRMFFCFIGATSTLFLSFDCSCDAPTHSLLSPSIS